ncbi:hypothetical protein CEUSTIGMA_g11675.t1 [Chlamydomonas eustigma]|uniref:Uncharacterized protein n=1 Tax=Chlamydomonas eustigma TaxID=1157962 RepID=A0A250XMX0_9CHLO|nr:hypothetical protein CEUSTIGMA_g11675.t1 [Chlamydomonas eustigma]|eukprot:GAX84252.1 hypothetical protein CEUSTIGMA_g11675.t1 [Chlamydomonas eustigma]
MFHVRDEHNFAYRRHIRRLGQQAGFEFCDEDETRGVCDSKFLEIQESWKRECRQLSSLIRCGLSASTTDHPEQSIGNTCQDNLFFWSSSGSDSAVDVVDSLTYQLMAPCCSPRFLMLSVYRAVYQHGAPLYPPRRLSIWAGPTVSQMYCISPQYMVRVTDEPQVFPIHHAHPLSGYLMVKLHGRRQKQQEDMRFYTAIRHVSVYGTKVSAHDICKLRQALPSLDVTWQQGSAGAAPGATSLLLVTADAYNIGGSRLGHQEKVRGGSIASKKVKSRNMIALNKSAGKEVQETMKRTTAPAHSDRLLQKLAVAAPHIHKAELREDLILHTPPSAAASRNIQQVMTDHHLPEMSMSSLGKSGGRKTGSRSGGCGAGGISKRSSNEAMEKQLSHRSWHARRQQQQAMERASAAQVASQAVLGPGQRGQGVFSRLLAFIRGRLQVTSSAGSVVHELPVHHPTEDESSLSDIPSSPPHDMDDELQAQQLQSSNAAIREDGTVVQAHPDDLMHLLAQAVHINREEVQNDPHIQRQVQEMQQELLMRMVADENPNHQMSRHTTASGRTGGSEPAAAAGVSSRQQDDDEDSFYTSPPGGEAVRSSDSGRSMMMLMTHQQATSPASAFASLRDVNGLLRLDSNSAAVPVMTITAASCPTERVPLTVGRQQGCSVHRSDIDDGAASFLEDGYWTEWSSPDDSSDGEEESEEVLHHTSASLLPFRTLRSSAPVVTTDNTHGSREAEDNKSSDYSQQLTTTTALQSQLAPRRLETLHVGEAMQGQRRQLNEIIAEQEGEPGLSEGWDQVREELRREQEQAEVGVDDYDEQATDVMMRSPQLQQQASSSGAAAPDEAAERGLEAPTSAATIRRLPPLGEVMARLVLEQAGQQQAVHRAWLARRMWQMMNDGDGDGDDEREQAEEVVRELMARPMLRAEDPYARALLMQEHQRVMTQASHNIRGTDSSDDWWLAPAAVSLRPRRGRASSVYMGQQSLLLASRPRMLTGCSAKNNEVIECGERYDGKWVVDEFDTGYM